jgi:hypothetical protein
MSSENRINNKLEFTPTLETQHFKEFQRVDVTDFSECSSLYNSLPYSVGY